MLGVGRVTQKHKNKTGRVLKGIPLCLYTVGLGLNPFIARYRVNFSHSIVIITLPFDTYLL